MLWPAWDAGGPRVEGLGRLRDVRPLHGSWSNGKVFLLYGTAGRVIVKRWSTAQSAQCAAEVTALRLLSGSGIGPEPVTLDGSLAPWPDGDGNVVTAQEFLCGEPSAGDYATVGAGIARLHNIFATADRPRGGGRLNQIAGLVDLAYPSPDIADLAVAGFRACAPHLDALAGCRWGRLHGDLMFENMLWRDGVPRFIDFEFSRADIRLLDLAVMRAPVRDRAGRLRVLPPEAQAEAVDGYQSAATTPLDRDELALLPIASLAHFLLVLRDVTVAGSRHVRSVAPVVATLLAELSRVFN